MIADSQTAGALYAYICQHPSEDQVRLEYSDLLEERGEDERAELIRLQIDIANAPTELPHGCQIGACEVSCSTCTAFWRAQPDGEWWQRERELFASAADAAMFGDKGLWGLPWPVKGWGPSFVGVLLPGGLEARCVFRRGFPAEVTLTASAFAGGPCGRCGGTGDENSMPGHDRLECRVCRGTGKTPGHAAALFRGAPVVGVKLDREPRSAPRGTSIVFWFLHATDDQPLDDPSYIPDALWKTGVLGEHGQFATRELALDALATAALLLGRRQGWPCPRCEAEGKIYTDMPRLTRTDCPDCDGRGHTVIG